MISLDELNKAISEIANLYTLKLKYIADKTPVDQDPYWSLEDLEELRKIKEQLNLLFKIRDNCQEIIKDLETLKSYTPK